MIKSNPLFGVGLHSYNYLFPYYSKSLGLARVATEREAHNLYLEVLAETGIVGFSVFFILLYTSFQCVFRARKAFVFANLKDYAGMTTGLLAGLVGYFTAAMFIHSAFPRYFFLLLGIALSLRLVAHNTILSTHSEK
jgi:O-antigen ligase